MKKASYIVIFEQEGKEVGRKFRTLEAAESYATMLTEWHKGEPQHKEIRVVSTR